MPLHEPSYKKEYGDGTTVDRSYPVSIDIVGMGLSMDDLSNKQWEIIAGADILVGGRRHLALFENCTPGDCKASLSCQSSICSQGGSAPGVSPKGTPHLPRIIPRETVVITRDIQGVISMIKEKMKHSRVVVLASGDPLFHGIGSTLIAALGKEHVRIHPNISSIAGAFAAIKEPWHDAVLISLHGKSPWKGVLARTIKNNPRIAVLTDHKRTPSWLARFLVDHGMVHHRMHVLENLGSPRERRLLFHDIREAMTMKFSSPNVVILMDGAAPVRNHVFPGMPDNCFFHENGLITKSEIRAVVFSKLRLVSTDHLLWDLGAGSGSVSIEASQFITQGTLFAVEKNRNRISDIKKNIKKFGAWNIEVVEANLPDGMDMLPDPDRIFLGGGGREIAEIIHAAAPRLSPGGIMVVNTVLMQTMSLALEAMKKEGLGPEMIQVHISVSKEMPFGDRLESLNPVWILWGEKQIAAAP
ncbi:MAG: precorrin-6y C5,15-methyltransferase (decarboxylating) subunit CbiE [Desulfamplus sp.]|nr:precorrin-6y C5,15-methyltransferase (decarboxylating) subunit CbiE [Desulfamplus sp.]